MPFGIDHNDAGNAPHPLPLVGGIAARTRHDARAGLLQRKRRELAQAERLLGGGRDTHAQRSPGLDHHAGRDHRVRPSLDPTLQLRRRDVETGDEGRSPQLGRPEAIGRRRERGPQLGQLECAYDAATIVHVHGRSGTGIELAQSCVRPLGVGVVETLETDPARRFGGRRDAQVDERSPQVQPRSSGDNGRAVRLDELVDCRVCELRVLAHRHRL